MIIWRMLTESIGDWPASAALNELTFSRRRIARDVRKVLQAAIANAENNHQLDVDRLVVHEASVGRAPDDGHNFPLLGVDIWEPDVFGFLDEYTAR